MKILVIDDEPLIHISIEKLIQACSKEDEVLHAYNGHEMLKMLEEHEIAMAYVDIKMPGPSGLEAIKLGKEISPDTRYYIMTGFNEFEYAKQAVKLKVEDYLMKPLDKKTIQETITAVRLQQYLAGERRKNLFRTWLESALNGRNIGLGEYKGYFCGLLMITVDGENLVSDPIPALFQGYEDLQDLICPDICRRNDLFWHLCYKGHGKPEGRPWKSGRTQLPAGNKRNRAFLLSQSSFR